ncbi:hypothetical protein M404DRAFT_31311 [Pisolithus tinctorius Marx 270]|uniref:Integrase catalytic domain-containing protein n=1 Tax=Pisolithus tinctorius Marx 270 TaxID=870435 RepID=A0A0C3JLK5_PISTI|nr:hypothetical protein M404DRAFT_31311 [Pisolithus tinctorius Marx 270]
MAIESKSTPDPICEPCLAGKMHANRFPSSSNHASRPLELVHSNVHSVGHPLLGIQILAKSEVFEAFKTFKAFAENQRKQKIKILSDDKGGEYMSNSFINFCSH